MKNDLDAYFRLPSFGVMVFMFWRPLSSFVEEAKEEYDRFKQEMNRVIKSVSAALFESYA
jgi:hypothetical protein